MGSALVAVRDANGRADFDVLAAGGTDLGRFWRWRGRFGSILATTGRNLIGRVKNLRVRDQIFGPWGRFLVRRGRNLVKQGRNLVKQGQNFDGRTPKISKSMVKISMARSKISYFGQKF